jgi:hypothetical protein
MYSTLNSLQDFIRDSAGGLHSTLTSVIPWEGILLILYLHNRLRTGFCWPVTSNNHLLMDFCLSFTSIIALGLVSELRLCLRQTTESCDPIYFQLENSWMIAHFNMTKRRPTLRILWFAARIICWQNCSAWSLATPISRPPTIQHFSMEFSHSIRITHRAWRTETLYWADCCQHCWLPYIARNTLK